MVDSAVNWLFVDLNSYFASIEQELCPELRGQPIAIVPIRIEAQTGCCIAVSYQAKAVALIAMWRNVSELFGATAQSGRTTRKGERPVCEKREMLGPQVSV